MESDKDNILVVLTARRLSPSARIVAATERVATTSDPAVIEGELFNAFARRRMEKSIAQMSGHYIVCGDRLRPITSPKNC